MLLRSERTPATAEPAPAGLEERPTRALPSMLRRLSPEKRTVILDLGPACGGNIRYLSQYSCRLHVGDLFDALAGSGALGELDPEPDAFESVCRESLALDSEERLDVVLAWSLLDYLKPQQITQLARVLAPHCHPQTVLFALITYHKQMPAQPGSFEMLSSDLLLYHSAGVAMRASPRYKEPDLARALPGFEVDQSFLLRHGQCEYVFNWHGNGAGH